MGATLKIGKLGFYIDANGVELIEEAIGTKKSINFYSNILNINIHDVKGVEQIEMVSNKVPNNYIHFSAISKVIDADGNEHTGSAIDSNDKILQFIVDQL